MGKMQRSGTQISESKVRPGSPRLLTIKKAAEYLGLTTWAMRERIWAGQIPVIRFPDGRKMYVDVNDLEAFIERHKRVIE